MIINDIKLSPYDCGDDALKRICAKKINVSESDISGIIIKKRSVDARKKQDIHIIYTVDCLTDGETAAPERRLEYIRLEKKPELPPVIVGSGPAGMMAGLYLAKAGACPVIIERGERVERRAKAVEKYFFGGELDTETNVQFGEGGAGTFSDGKLTTGTKDGRIAEVKHIFTEAGAPEDIIYSAKPHIGTDILMTVVKNIRKRIEKLGGRYLFNTRLTDIVTNGGIITGIETNTGQISCGRLILACGHSARDTFEMLERRGVHMEPKPFSIGARIEYPQALLNEIQYGKYAHSDGAMKALGAADYKLAVRTSSGRGVYTFCMCPGGRVVAAASENESICTNGMSLRSRDGINGNSAVLVGITPEDFGSDGCLAGMFLQREIERAAYAAPHELFRSSRAPAMLLRDLLAGKSAAGCGAVAPSYMPGVIWSDIGCCLPEYIVSALREGIILFDKKMKGFALPDAVLTAPETRSSSPVRITRGEDMQSNIRGIYPCGEGAGYAGGIMSAAVDGLRCAEALAASLI